MTSQRVENLGGLSLSPHSLFTTARVNLSQCTYIILCHAQQDFSVYTTLAPPQLTYTVAAEPRPYRSFKRKLRSYLLLHST